MGRKLLWASLVLAPVTFVLNYVFNVGDVTLFVFSAASLVLFAVLPWGVRSQQEQGAIAPGSDPGAPARPALKHKLAWTTIIAGIVFALWYVVYSYRLIALDDLAALLGIPLR